MLYVHFDYFPFQSSTFTCNTLYWYNRLDIYVLKVITVIILDGHHPFLMSACFNASKTLFINLLA